MSVNRVLLDWILADIADVPHPRQIVELGDQELCDMPELQFEQFADYIESLHKADECCTIDISGRNGSHAVDLGEPLAEWFQNKFDVLTNVGTIEHVNNQYQAWQNCHDITKAGGVMLHCLPRLGYWEGHGRYLYTDGFVRDLAKLCGYQFVRQPEELIWHDNQQSLILATFRKTSESVFPGALAFATLPLADSGDLTNTGDYWRKS